jgi:hypothetical protein
LLLIAAAGCGSGVNQPKFDALHPVTGTVLQSGKAVVGGVVRFTPDPDKPEFLINSEVGTDGKFKLSTVRTTDTTGERKPGAPAGKYSVTFLPKLGDQTTGYQNPVTLPQPVMVEAKDNDLQIDLPAK